MFYPFRDKKELLSGFPPLYQNKLLEPGVQTVVNSSIEFEPYGDLVDEASSRYNTSMLDNQDHFGQIGEAVYSNDLNDENTESNKNSAIPNLMQTI